MFDTDLYSQAQKKITHKYLLANIVTLRMGQLMDGADPLVEAENMAPINIALKEIAEGLIEPHKEEITSGEDLSGRNKIMGDEKPEGESFTFKDKRRRFDEEDSATEEQEAPEPESASEPSEKIESKAADTTEDDAEAPAINFATFILSMASNAAYHMGGFQDEVSGKTSVNLDLAKQSIDILAILEEKTKGNLNEEEANLLTHSLYDLRMKFVEVSKQ